MSAKNQVHLKSSSRLPATPHMVKKLASDDDSGLHEDSGFISPPTLVKFEAVTPHGYNLRHMTSGGHSSHYQQPPSRWSSTPLPASDDSLATPGLFKSSSTPIFTNGDQNPKPQLVEIVDFRKRLESFDHHESDSGKSYHASAL